MSKVEVKKWQNFSFDPIKLKDPDYNDTMQFELNENNLYEWKNYPSLIAEPRKQNTYNQQTYVITDNLTRSCSGMFASLMREHDKALFIGEETGATQCGSGGMVTVFQLPYSKISIFFSTAQYSCAVKNPTNSRGVMPDMDFGALKTLPLPRD